MYLYLYILDIFVKYYKSNITFSGYGEYNYNQNGETIDQVSQLE